MTDSSQLGFAVMAAPDSRAREVLNGKDVPWEITVLQRRILRELLWYVGGKHAISLAQLKSKTGSDDRAIKDAIRSLVVDFKVRVGASRTEPAGYYLISTSEEARATAEPYISEIRKLAQRVRVILDPHDLSEFEGQLLLDTKAKEGTRDQSGNDC